MDKYEAAVTMYGREHDRWNQWALFFFGAIVAVFVLWGQIREVIPLWVPAIFGFVLSCMWILVALTIRASTRAWRKTVKVIGEKGKENVADPFHICDENLTEFNRWKDFMETLQLWKREPYRRITRLLTLFGVIAAVFFMFLFVLSLTNVIKEDKYKKGANNTLSQCIGEIQKNALEKVVATLGEYKGKQRVDIRTYFLPDQAEPDNPDNWIPTKKGINLSLDNWVEFKELVKKIDKVIGKEDKKD